MEQIAFRAWRLAASVVDSDTLRLDIESADNSDITEVGEAAGGAHEGEQYTMRLTTQNIEEGHRRAARRPAETEAGDADEDESGQAWLADEDETIYLRGWEVTALVDEEGLLNVYVEKGEGADIFEVEPIESGAPLGPKVVVRLAAEEVLDEDEEEEEDAEGDYEENEDYDELDELGDEYDEYADEDDEDEDEDDFEDEFDDEDVY